MAVWLGALQLKDYLCTNCGASFEAPFHNKRKYCSSCSAANQARLERDRQKRRLAERGPLPPIPYACARCNEIFFAEIHSKRKFCETCLPESQREWRRVYCRAYRQTEAGSLQHLKSQERRQRCHTDIDNYINRIRNARENQEPCACGAPFVKAIRAKPGHQIDHILALALGGTDDNENLQVLCWPCHQEKSIDDRQKIRTSAKTSCLIYLAGDCHSGQSLPCRTRRMPQTDLA